MSSPSSPNNNEDEPARRGKTTVHNFKATPKVLRPVQPQHVYDSYEGRSSREERPSREERKARRRSAQPDFATFGMFAFFGVLALGVIFYLVQGASTMPFDTVGDTQEEIARKNEETRRINEMRAREAAAHQPVVEPAPREIPTIPPTVRTPVVPPPQSAPAPAVSTPRPAPPGPLGGISAGLAPESSTSNKPQNEAPKPATPPAPAATPNNAPDASGATKSAL